MIDGQNQALDPEHDSYVLGSETLVEKITYRLKNPRQTINTYYLQDMPIVLKHTPQEE